VTRFFAACPLGVENALQQELRELGAGRIVKRPGGCAFEGPPALGYACCLWLRSAVRMQEELAYGRVTGREDLYELTQTIDWSRSITPLQTLAVDASIRDSFANDSRFPALVVKDAVCDQFRDRTGRRPSVDRQQPDLPIKLVLQRDSAVIYRELGGAPLHKRGYREIQHKSPLNEALAAGLLLLTGDSLQDSVCDPMCGSATLLIEAAFLAADRAPGLSRSFAFERFVDCDTDAWRQIYDDAEARAESGARQRRPLLLGNDRHPGALAIAREAIRNAGLTDAIRLTEGDARSFVPDAPPSLVVCNPPYGQRLDDDDEALADSWRSLGNFLHDRAQGAMAFVLSGRAESTRHLGLRADRKWTVKNGPIDCRWVKYSIGG
jgi:23S rRNA G2445 N2-methylase RlmL